MNLRTESVSVTSVAIPPGRVVLLENGTGLQGANQIERDNAQHLPSAIGLIALCRHAAERKAAFTSLTGERVTRPLNQLQGRGWPHKIVMDNGPEFRGRAWTDGPITRV